MSTKKEKFRPGSKETNWGGADDGGKTTIRDLQPIHNVQDALQYLTNEQIAMQALKQQIGFGTAFKVTLGYYAARFVAMMLGLVTLFVVGSVGLLILKAVLS